MAERTGNVKLDALIEQFIAEDPDVVFRQGFITHHAGRLSELAQAESADGNCAIVSFHFAKWLRDQGLKAETLHPLSDGPEIFGYDDRSIAGHEAHAVVLVRDKEAGCTYSIDWTAAQYGYNEFPLVQRVMDPRFQWHFNTPLPIAWQREWTLAPTFSSDAPEPATGKPDMGLAL